MVSLLTFNWTGFPLGLSQLHVFSRHIENFDLQSIAASVTAYQNLVGLISLYSETQASYDSITERVR